MRKTVWMLPPIYAGVRLQVALTCVTLGVYAALGEQTARADIHLVPGAGRTVGGGAVGREGGLRAGAYTRSAFELNVSAFYGTGGHEGIDEGARGESMVYEGVFTVYFVSESAQVELRSERVYAPAWERKSLRSLMSATDGCVSMLISCQ